MRVPTFYCLLVILIMKTAASLKDDEISRWIYGLRTLLKDCPQIPRRNSDQQDFIPVLRYCLQHRAILAVDTLLTDDVIPIFDGINLVRYKDRQYNYTTSREYDRNQTKYLEDNESAENQKNWYKLIMKKLTRLFNTHVLKIDFEQLSRVAGLSTDNSYPEEEDEEEEEADEYKEEEEKKEKKADEEYGENLVRGRRRHHHRRKDMMFPLIMMGFLFVGTILIPMGFQFLAVLGGKALILAKMALMLSSIQGLKKIATSGVNYGLYHSPGGPEGWHQRSHQETSEKPPPVPIQYPYQRYNSRGIFGP